MKKSALFAIALLMSGLAHSAHRHFKTDILRDTFGFTKATPATVKMDSLQQGCPARDCIPALDKPAFETLDQASWLKDDDLVLALTIGKQTHVYPTRILIHHEIVNDQVGGIPVAVTFCPLCGSGVAFERRIGKKATTFGVAGVLHNDNLVLYDRASNTLWAQVTGEAMMGEKSGAKLKQIPLSMALWGQWHSHHPAAMVLSRSTGFPIDYSQNHYADYRKSERIFYPVSARDARLHVKEVIYGTVVDGTPVAYTDAWLGKTAHTDQVGGIKIQIGRNADGSVDATRGDTHQALVLVRGYWFSWYAFHTNTLLRATTPNRD